MLQAFVSFLIVFISGYFGGFLGTPGCVMATIAASTACIVYAIKNKN